MRLAPAALLHAPDGCLQSCRGLSELQELHPQLPAPAAGLQEGGKGMALLDGLPHTEATARCLQDFNSSMQAVSAAARCKLPLQALCRSTAAS